MNRRYWKFAATVVSGSAAFWMLSGCSTQSPRSQDQAYSTTTTSYSSQSSQNSVAMSNQGAPVYNSDSGWQYGYKPAQPAKAGKPMNEAAGSQAQVYNSSSQWQSADADQKLETPRASEEGQPHAAQGQPNANIQPHNTAPMASQSSTSSSGKSTQWVASTPMITEGPNSGGRWHPGLTQQTLQPNATWSSGWLIGYSNPNYEPPQVIVRDSAGASTSSTSSSPQQQWNEQQQQINRQQQEINRQQQQIRQLQQQMNEHQQRMNQQNQSTPSDNSTSQ